MSVLAQTPLRGWGRATPTSQQPLGGGKSYRLPQWTLYMLWGRGKRRGHLTEHLLALFSHISAFLCLWARSWDPRLRVMTPLLPPDPTSTVESVRAAGSME